VVQPLACNLAQDSREVPSCVLRAAAVDPRPPHGIVWVAKLLDERTRDLRALPASCAPALSPKDTVRGRHDEASIIEGKRLLPIDFEEVLLRRADVAGWYQIVRGPARVRLRVKARGALDADARGRLATAIARELQEELAITIAVEVAAPGELPRSQGKARRIVAEPSR
jgi:phenylacetate-CoA ligase